MKRIGIIIALLVGFIITSCGQSPEQWFPGLTKFDTTQFHLFTSAPTDPISGYMVNVNGYALWFDGVVWDTLQTGGGGGGGVTDHGALTGLGDDDHSHYYNLARLTSWFVTKDHDDLVNSGFNDHTQIDVHLASITNPHAVDETDILAPQAGESGKFYTTDGTNGSWLAVPGGIIDHGLLNGLTDDDHVAYHTDSRANIWFTTQNLSNLANKSHLDLDPLTIGSNTHAVLDAGLSASTSHISNLFNPHSVTHAMLPDLLNDDHTQYTLRSEWLQNGFEDLDDVDLSWDDATRTLTIQPQVAAFDYFLNGIRYSETGSIVETITDTEGLWVFYLDSEGSITSTNSPSHADIDNVILNYSIIAYLYWDATNNDGRLMQELHGYRMSPATHHWIHDNIGAIYKEGMALADFVSDASGDVTTHAQFSIAAGEFYDEDIEHDLDAILSTTGLEIWYLDGSNWRWTTNSGYSILTTGTGRMAFNDAGSQTEVTNNDFALAHVFATNIVTDAGVTPQYIAIQGQAEYTNLGNARTGADTEINSLVYGDIPLEEIVPIATVIFQTSDGYSNPVQSRVRTNDAGDDYVDWRNSSLKANGGSIADHGALSGLADDDHIQYHNDARALTWLGLQSILTLTDTPASLSGQAGKVLAVNTGETALEFVVQTGGSSPVSTLISTTNCTYNSTTYIVAGDTFDIGLSFRYDAQRDITTELSQSGHIDIVYDSIAGTVSYTSNYVGADLGLNLTADLNAGVVRISAAVDNTNTNDLTFNLYSSTYSDIDTIIMNSPDKAVSYTDCPDNTITYISLGTTADVAYRIHYVSERNIVPARKQSGMIDVLYDDVAGTVSVYNDYVGADLGFALTGDINGGYVRLIVTVDNSTTNNLLFDYKTISKFYE